MIEVLTLLLRIAGVGLIGLAAVHVPVGRRLCWVEEAALLSPVNGTIFRVHAFFICLVLVLMGLPCLVEPEIFIEPTRAGRWISWSLASFWLIRLYCQWFVYRRELWRGKRLETSLHFWMTLVWVSLTAVFTACGLAQTQWWGIF